MNGVVTKTTGKRYTVKTDIDEIVQCRLKGKFRIKGIKSNIAPGYPLSQTATF